MPDLPGRARNELSAALVDLADLASALAEDVAAGPPAARPGEVALAVRRVRMLSLQAVYAARNHELAAGTTWAELAEALCLTEDDARAVHAAAYQEWSAGRRGPLPGLPPHLGMAAGRGPVAGRWARVRARLRGGGRAAAR